MVLWEHDKKGDATGSLLAKKILEYMFLHEQNKTVYNRSHCTFYLDS